MSTLLRRLRSLVWLVRVWLIMKLCGMCYVLSVQGDNLRKKASSSLGKAIFSNLSVSELRAVDPAVLGLMVLSWVKLKNSSLKRLKSKLDDPLKDHSKLLLGLKLDSYSQNTNSPPMSFQPTELDTLRCLEGMYSPLEAPTSNSEATCCGRMKAQRQSGTHSQKDTSIPGYHGTKEHIKTILKGLS